MLESLAKHLKASTAISLSSLTLTRVACTSLLIDVSGRLKIFDTAGIEGTKLVLGKLVALAAKEPLPS